MPIYDYRCSECDEEFEQLVLPSSSEPSCPTCGGEELEKLISPCSISTGHTRGRAKESVRRRNRKMQQEQLHQEHERLHDHDH